MQAEGGNASRRCLDNDQGFLVCWLKVEDIVPEVKKNGAGDETDGEVTGEDREDQDQGGSDQLLPTTQVNGKEGLLPANISKQDA